MCWCRSQRAVTLLLPTEPRTAMFLPTAPSIAQPAEDRLSSHRHRSWLSSAPDTSTCQVQPTLFRSLLVFSSVAHTGGVTARRWGQLRAAPTAVCGSRVLGGMPCCLPALQEKRRPLLLRGIRGGGGCCWLSSGEH